MVNGEGAVSNYQFHENIKDVCFMYLHAIVFLLEGSQNGCTEVHYCLSVSKFLCHYHALLVFIVVFISVPRNVYFVEIIYIVLCVARGKQRRMVYVPI